MKMLAIVSTLYLFGLMTVTDAHAEPNFIPSIRQQLTPDTCRPPIEVRPARLQPNYMRAAARLSSELYFVGRDLTVGDRAPNCILSVHLVKIDGPSRTARWRVDVQSTMVGSIELVGELPQPSLVSTSLVTGPAVYDPAQQQIVVGDAAHALLNSDQKSINRRSTWRKVGIYSAVIGTVVLGSVLAISVMNSNELQPYLGLGALALFGGG